MVHAEKEPPPTMTPQIRYPDPKKHNSRHYWQDQNGAKMRQKAAQAERAATPPAPECARIISILAAFDFTECAELYAGESITLTAEGLPLEFIVKAIYDESPDLSWLGSYSSEPENEYSAKVDNPRGADFWINPTPGGEAPAKFYADQLSYHKHQGMSKADAHRAALADIAADIERLKGYALDKWHMLGISVTASINGADIGESSLWGIESDNPEYFAEVAQDMAAEALREADDHAGELRAALEQFENLYNTPAVSKARRERRQKAGE